MKNMVASRMKSGCLLIDWWEDLHAHVQPEAERTKPIVNVHIGPKESKVNAEGRCRLSPICEVMAIVPTVWRKVQVWLLTFMFQSPTMHYGRLRL